MATSAAPVGWAILAALVIAIALLVNIPVALLTLAFVSGAPLFTIMLGAAVLGALSLPRAFDAEFDGMVEHMLHVGLGDQVEVMSTIPLFIYAGYLLAESGTADRLVRFANAALGWMPGGLAIVTIGTCALFTVFTGASRRHDHRARRRADAGAVRARLPREVLDRPHRRHRLGRPAVPACPAAVHLRHGLRPQSQPIEPPRSGVGRTAPVPVRRHRARASC